MHVMMKLEGFNGKKLANKHSENEKFNGNAGDTFESTLWNKKETLQDIQQSVLYT